MAFSWFLNLVKMQDSSHISVKYRSRTIQRLTPLTYHCIRQMYDALDYRALESVYCEDGGKVFWQNKRKPCQRMGNALAKALRPFLPQNGKSLYVGAGVAEISPLLMEIIDLHRSVFPYNLRETEVQTLNQSSTHQKLTFQFRSAVQAEGSFDHVWMVSVLNDPEQFPHASSLSYGRADPLSFDPDLFTQERARILLLTHNCLKKLAKPGLITTSVEEIPWITHWCDTHRISYEIQEPTYPTALVGDPVCFVRVVP